MPTTTISALASGTTPTGSEAIPVDQGGNTVKLTPDQIVQRVSGAVLAQPIPVGNGGTGAASGLTANALLVAQGTSAFTTVATGASGYLLVSNGSGAAPGFAANTLSLLGISSGSSGQVLTANGGGGASFAAPSSFGSVSGNTLLGNNASGSAVPTALTVSQVLALLNIQLTPQGRLTLASGTPRMTTDVTGATGIYYLPDLGYYLPVWDGSRFINWPFTLLSTTTTTTGQVANTNYDIYGYASGGTTLALGFSPAWSSQTARGTGAGTTELTQLNGLWVNKNAINLRNGPTLTSGVASGFATYLGTVAIGATSGQTAMQFKPTAAVSGTNSWLGLYNAYNRVPVESWSRDSTSSWTYSTATWRTANSGNNNRISYVDGLAQERAIATYSVYTTAAASVGQSQVGIVFNATSGTPANIAQVFNAGASSVGSTLVASENNNGLGLNFAQAMENSAGGNNTFLGGGFQLLKLQLSM